MDHVELLEECRGVRCILVTYNTMMKGSTMAGDIYAAKGILGHMAVDIFPDSAESYSLQGGAM